VLSTFIRDGNRKPYNFKRRCIEHSLYGVDIDPGAVEIAKLRLWLSLVVDEDDIKNIKPLPNLTLRPEGRYQWGPGSTESANNPAGLPVNTGIFGMDVILSF